MNQLLSDISSCVFCKDSLPLPPRPVVSASPKSKVCIIGQAPGLAVHKTGVPWDDKSGERLRDWLGVSNEQFYDPDLFALVPMGFCYPGRGKSGDLPPRPECAPLWHKKLFDEMKSIELTILIGNYSQKEYLGKKAEKTLTETVKQFKNYLPEIIVLPHPSPRNNIWMAKNEWFSKELLPELKRAISKHL